MSPRALLCAGLAAALWLLVLAGGAQADVFGSAQLLSADAFRQAEYAHDPAVSEDGRWIVFDGSVGGVTGVWRRETRPGAELEQVAGGDATMPSVSADGHYVSFTTNEGESLGSITDGRIPSPEPVQEAVSVYVRDMDKHAVADPETGATSFEPGAFTLVSAKNHSGQSLSYTFPGASAEQSEVDSREFGAVAPGPSAISADGSKVVFVTTAESDLAGPGTPAHQVAVRDLNSEETQLASVLYDPATGKPALDAEGNTEPVPLLEGGYGAVYKLPGSEAFQPRNDQLPRAYAGATLPAASISADGSAVAWLGQNIPAQARTLGGEEGEMSTRYAEPLWRRISGGSAEPTRRVSGGSDPEDPACEANPESRLPATPSSSDPCQGPFATQDSGGYGMWNGKEPGAAPIPRLSADGDEVAFISSAKLTSEASGFVIGALEYNSDAYVENMTARSRKEGFVQLTQFASAEPQRVSTNADVTTIAISSDGRQVAFTTRRTVFPLAVPAFVSTPAAVPGLGELYDADLSNQTLTRVTQGYEGGAPQHAELESTNEDPYPRLLDGALWPSFTGNGEALAFSTTASNIVYGDGNTPSPLNHDDFADGADVFLVPRLTFAPEPTPQTISPAPPNPTPEAPWKLILTATSLHNGTVLLRVRVPGAGHLTASGGSRVPVLVHGKRRIVKRTVARAAAVARVPLTLQLHLDLPQRYVTLALRRGGLLGTVQVTFSAKGHQTLRRSLSIRFARKASAARRKAAKR